MRLRLRLRHGGWRWRRDAAAGRRVDGVEAGAGVGVAGYGAGVDVIGHGDSCVGMGGSLLGIVDGYVAAFSGYDDEDSVLMICVCSSQGI